MCASMHVLCKYASKSWVKIVCFDYIYIIKLAPMS